MMVFNSPKTVHHRPSSSSGTWTQPSTFPVPQLRRYILRLVPFAMWFMYSPLALGLFVRSMNSPRPCGKPRGKNQVRECLINLRCTHRDPPSHTLLPQLCSPPLSVDSLRTPSQILSPQKTCRLLLPSPHHPSKRLPHLL